MTDVSVQRFEELVAEAMDAVPEPFASALGEVAVLIEPDVAPGEPPRYGLYIGHPLTQPGGMPGPPPRILIAMRPLVDDFPDEDDLREEVRITLLHELGHHLGMDEAQLDALGYG